ncbi:unnamed protein product, partial [Urochloa humidicola]
LDPPGTIPDATAARGETGRVRRGAVGGCEATTQRRELASSARGRRVVAHHVHVPDGDGDRLRRVLAG